MLLAFPLVKNEVTISQEAPFFCNLLARGIIPQVQSGINAPIMLEKNTKTIPFFCKTFSKNESGKTSERTADIKSAIKNVGIVQIE